MELDPNWIAGVWLLGVVFLVGSTACLFEAAYVPSPGRVEKFLDLLMNAYFDISLLVFLGTSGFLLGFLREGKYGPIKDLFMLQVSVGFIELVGLTAMVIGLHYQVQACKRQAQSTRNGH